MSRLFQGLLVGGWLLLLVGGMALLHELDSRPRDAGAVPDRKPMMDLHADGSELILFVHPKCTCTTETLTALREFLHQKQPLVHSLRIVFVGYQDASEDWWSGENWEQASAITLAKLERDAGGVLARQYGVRTSGHALIYSADGRLLLSGGLLATLRGSRQMATSILNEIPPANSLPTTLPVFGCSLFDE